MPLGFGGLVVVWLFSYVKGSSRDFLASSNGCESRQSSKKKTVSERNKSNE